MRVGLNLVPLGAASGGVGRYAVELARALRAEGVELHAFLSRDASPELREAAGDRVIELPVRLDGLPMHVPAQYLVVPAIAAARRLEILHSPANAGPWLVPGVATVVTVHDMIWSRFGSEWGSPRAVAAAGRAIPASARRSNRVITDSQDAADDLAELLGVDPRRTDVVPLGVRPPALPGNAARARRLLGLGDETIVLCVAQKRPYKNLAALVRAVQALPGAMLVLPGAPTVHEDELRLLDAAGRVRFVGYVDDAALEDLFAAATCVALPSRIEGFGLGVLEAMIRGVPVACSAIGAHREVAGEAALLFEPDDDAQIHDALRRLLTDEALRSQLVARGRERAASYTWEATVRKTITAYERAVSSRSR